MSKTDVVEENSTGMHGVARTRFKPGLSDCSPRTSVKFTIEFSIVMPVVPGKFQAIGEGLEVIHCEHLLN